MISTPENLLNPMQTIEGCFSTIAVHHIVCMHKLSMCKSWWQMKLRLLHSIILPCYILWQLWCPIKKEIQTTVLFMLHPMLPYMNGLIYWASIIITICGLLLVKLTNVITPHKTPRIRHPKHPHPVMCMFPAPTSPPLPIRRMVLNTVQLNQSFVGYLAKLGKHFMGFMDSMHRIG